MSALYSPLQPAGEQSSGQDAALDTEEFIRRYYGQVNIEHFLSLYNGRKDLQRLNARPASAYRGSVITDEKVMESIPTAVRKTRPKEVSTFHDDDVSAALRIYFLGPKGTALLVWFLLQRHFRSWQSTSTFYGQ